MAIKLGKKILKNKKYLYVYAVYNPKGELILTADFMREVGEVLNCSESIVGKGVKFGYFVRAHTVKRFEDQSLIPEQIDVKPPSHKLRIAKDGRSKRSYLIYKRDGRILEKRLFVLSEAMEKLGVAKDTVLDAVKKIHLANKHIVVLYKGDASKTPVYPKLSPLHDHFQVFQYNRKGELIEWYTNISYAMEVTGVKYSIIRNCILKNESTHPDFFFTNTIPKTNFKTRRVKFIKPAVARINLKVEKMGMSKIMSMKAAAKFIDVSYDKLRKRVHSEKSSFIIKNHIVEVIS